MMEPGGEKTSQLTLFKPGGADSAHPLLLASPIFFRHPCHTVNVNNIQFRGKIGAHMW